MSKQAILQGYLLRSTDTDVQDLYKVKTFITIHPALQNISEFKSQRRKKYRINYHNTGNNTLMTVTDA